MKFNAFSIRSTNATFSAWRFAALGLLYVLGSCTPGEVKAGLGPNEPDATAIAVAPAKSSIVVGESVLIRATARTSNGNPAPAEVEWTADGGSLAPLTDSTAQFSAAVAGSYKIRGRGKKSPNPQDSTVVVVTQPVSPIVSMSVSPNPATLTPGGVQAFTASATRQDGTMLMPSVTWSATGGTITASGVYTAGAVAGSYSVTANLVGGTLSASVPVTVAAVVSPIASLTISPPTATVTSGASQAFTASATRQDGSTLTPGVTWSATGGSINGSGVYTGGNTAGSYRVIAVLQGGSLADTSAITIPAPVLQAVILTPPSVSLNTGATQQFSVSGQWSDGSTTAPAVTWTATGGSINGNGLYTAGNTAGSFRVIARQSGGTLADTSTVTLTATPPVLQAVILTPSSASLNTGATQQFAVSGLWSDGSTTAPAVTYSATGGTINSSGLYTAGNTAGSFRVIARQSGGTLTDTSTVTLTSIGGGSGTTLLTEGFEDTNISGRGWFDATSISIASDARPGSSGTKALQWHWTSGMTAPQGSSRVDFAPSTSVYLSYWVKTSSNWIGSNRDYHPHMFHFLTTADDRYIGPSISHLTLYDELVYVPSQGGLTPVLSMQDALMIDPNNLMVDLTNVTEQRAIGGYNGRPEPGLAWDAYPYGGGQYTNYKLFQPGTIVMSDATKSSWHHVESYWQMNTISGGKGQPNGVVQYWFDGALIIDRHDIYFRTAVNSSMQFRTFVMAPYIGDGSPRDQYMWIDDLVVRTARP